MSVTHRVVGDTELRKKHLNLVEPKAKDVYGWPSLINHIHASVAPLMPSDFHEPLSRLASSPSWCIFSCWIVHSAWISASCKNCILMHAWISGPYHKNCRLSTAASCNSHTAYNGATLVCLMLHATWKHLWAINLPFIEWGSGKYTSCPPPTERLHWDDPKPN